MTGARLRVPDGGVVADLLPQRSDTVDIAVLATASRLKISAIEVVPVAE